MIVVHLYHVIHNVDSHRLRAGCLSVSTFHIVSDDVKVGVIDHIVGTCTHEVKPLSIKGHVVRVADG